MECGGSRPLASTDTLECHPSGLGEIEKSLLISFNNNYKLEPLLGHDWLHGKRCHQSIVDTCQAASVMCSL